MEPLIELNQAAEPKTTVRKKKDRHQMMPFHFLYSSIELQTTLVLQTGHKTSRQHP